MWPCPEPAPPSGASPGTLTVGLDRVRERRREAVALFHPKPRVFHHQKARFLTCKAC